MRLESLFVLSLLFSGIGCDERTASKPKDLKHEEAIRIGVSEIEPLHAYSIRGLYAVDDVTIWASGANGVFLKCTDGQNWISDTIVGYTHLDFRDVHAFDETTALLMAAGDEGRILRTENGGESWMEVHTDLREGIFLDGMDFHANVGYCYGDPIDGKMVIIKSEDYGKTWVAVDTAVVPSSLVGEAGFAASGTGVIVDEKMRYTATGGGSVSRVFSQFLGQGSWSAFNTPMRSAEGCGIFSIASSRNNLVAVGGCYLDSTSTEGNCAISADSGKTWTLITENPPRGYRSCVAYSPLSNLMIACGRTGVDFSTDEGLTWQKLSEEGYYACALADSTGWLMGKGGKLAQLSW